MLVHREIRFDDRISEIGFRKIRIGSPFRRVNRSMETHSSPLRFYRNYRNNKNDLMKYNWQAKQSMSSILYLRQTRVRRDYPGS